MGASPYAYNLSLFFPKYIDFKWIKIFTKELLKLQKKYNFYLLGGDLSKSDKLIITSTFFGFTQQNKIITQNKVCLNNDIWITGNIGDSYIGFQILSNKINIRNSKIKKYFLNKYYFPKACKIDSEIFKYVKSITDISDGFIGDLKKMLDNKYGAKLNLDKIPFSNFLKKLISENKISNKLILNSGDNYELIIISDKKYRNKIINISKKSKLKITRVGVVSKKIQILDDSNNILNMPREYDHFL